MNAPRGVMGLAVALVVSPAWAATGGEGGRVGLTLFAVALLLTSAKIGWSRGRALGTAGGARGAAGGHRPRQPLAARRRRSRCRPRPCRDYLLSPRVSLTPRDKPQLAGRGPYRVQAWTGQQAPGRRRDVAAVSP